MHGAPAVQWPVGVSPWGGRLSAALVALGIAVTVVWGGLAPGVLPAVGLAAWGLYAVWVWRKRADATGVLAWDGGRWSWWPDGAAEGWQAVHVDLALDLQQLLLVRLQLQALAPGTAGSPRVVWLWLTPTDDPGRWPDLRRALHSRAGPEVA